MKINEALYKISLSLLLDENLSWKKEIIGEKITKKIELDINGTKIILMCEIIRQITLDEHIVYISSIKIYENYRLDDEIMCYSACTILPYNRVFISAFADKEILTNFIETSLPEHELVYDIKNQNYNLEIINYAENLYSSLSITINEAFNRIILSMLLKDSLSWQKSKDYSVISNSMLAMIGNRPGQIECKILKIKGNDASTDEYWIEADVKNSEGKSVMSYESSFKAPKSNNIVDKKLSIEELKNFITMYENTEGTIFYSGEEHFDTDIVDFAESVYRKTSFEKKFG